MMSNTNCFQCGIGVQTYKLGDRNFCSRECYHVFRIGYGRNRVQKHCAYCHEEVARCPSHTKDIKNFFCSLRCKNLWQGGKKHNSVHKKDCQCIKCNGKGYWLGKKRDPEMVERIRQQQIGNHPSLKTRKKMSYRATHRSPEITRKSLIRACPSSLESKMIEIIKILMLHIIFTGNGTFLVGRKCPDFIYIDKKIAIDVFYRRHKEDFRGGLQKWKARRRAYFARRGWKLIFLDETMVNEEYISKKLKNL